MSHAPAGSLPPARPTSPPPPTPPVSPPPPATRSAKPEPLSAQSLAAIDAVCSGFPLHRRLQQPLTLAYRAGTLLRDRVAAELELSSQARLLYVLMAHHCGVVSGDDYGLVNVPLSTISRWLCCSRRSASRAVAELTRTGRVPLLLQQPGKPGRASAYRFVFQPTAILREMEQRAEDAKHHRHLRVLEKQRQVFRAEATGELDAPAAARKLVATKRFRQVLTRQPKERKTRVRQHTPDPVAEPVSVSR